MISVNKTKAAIFPMQTTLSLFAQIKTQFFGPPPPNNSSFTYKE